MYLTSDLRDKEHSSVIYESPRPDTLLFRLAWNRFILRYMTVLLMEICAIVVLDIRARGVPVDELHRHRACVNMVRGRRRTAGISVQLGT